MLEIAVLFCLAVAFINQLNKNQFYFSFVTFFKKFLQKTRTIFHRFLTFYSSDSYRINNQNKR